MQKIKRFLSKYYFILGLIFVLVLLEILTLSYRWPKTDRENQSIIYFIAGILISILPLLPVKIDLPNKNTPFYSDKLFYLNLSAVFVLIVFLFLSCPSLYKKIPIHPKTADMIPILSAMAERYVKGEEVYAFIQISDPMYPIYLPMLWLPFIIPNTFNFDPRWLIEVFLCIGIVLILFTVPKKQLNSRQFLVLIPLSLFILGIIKKEVTLITMTQEGIVIAYYMFFAFVLVRFYHNPYLTSIAITLCLLSRFTLLFFFGFYIIFLWKYQSKKFAYKVFGLTSLMVLVIMTVSQAIFHLDIFMGLSDNYLQAIITKKEKYFDLIKYSMGIAKFFKYENLPILHTLHLIFQITPLLAAMAYYHYAKPKINKFLFMLCTAKLSLVLFFNLLIMPYTYLFYTSMFYSMVILYVYANGYLLLEKVAENLTLTVQKSE